MFCGESSEKHVTRAGTYPKWMRIAHTVHPQANAHSLCLCYHVKSASVVRAFTQPSQKLHEHLAEYLWQTVVSLAHSSQTDIERRKKLTSSPSFSLSPPPPLFACGEATRSMCLGIVALY